MTAQKMSDKKGDEKRERMDDGRSCRPVAFPPYDGGMYRKRACAGGVVLKVFRTLSSKWRKFISSIISACANLSK